MRLAKLECRLVPEPDLVAENEKLRAILDECRQRELDDLRQRLADATESARHYREEAQRNADLGRQIAADYERQVRDLQSRNQILEQARANVRPNRPG